MQEKIENIERPPQFAMDQHDEFLPDMRRSEGREPHGKAQENQHWPGQGTNKF